MAKKNKVTQVRRGYVQSRAEKTGKTSAEDKAKFRQRFEKLATTSSGRAKIQKVTGLSGVRKDLRAAYSAPKSKTVTSNTNNTGSSLPGFGVAANRTYTEAQTEIALRSNSTPYKAPVQKHSVDVTIKPLSASQSSGTSTTKKVVIGAGIAGGAYALSNRAVKLQQIANLNAKTSALGMNAAEVQAQLQGLGYRPTGIGGAAKGLFRGRFGGGASRLLGR